MQGSAGSALRAPQRRQRSASEGSSALSSALAAAVQGYGEEDEVLDTIYANWGTLQGREDAGTCLLRPSHFEQRLCETT